MPISILIPQQDPADIWNEAEEAEIESELEAKVEDETEVQVQVQVQVQVVGDPVHLRELGYCLGIAKSSLWYR